MSTHGSCGFSGHQAAHEDLGTGDGGAESLAEAYLCGSQAKPRQLLSSCLALWHALRAQSRQKSWLAEEVLLASCSRLQNILFPQLTLLALCGLNTYTQNQWDRHCTFRGLTIALRGWAEKHYFALLAQLTANCGRWYHVSPSLSIWKWEVIRVFVLKVTVAVSLLILYKSSQIHAGLYRFLYSDLFLVPCA